jgi:hypothetical protein
MNAGTCTSLPATSPGSPTCSPLVCDGVSGSCPTTCTSDAGCAGGFRCELGECKVLLPDGTVGCKYGTQCQSGFCADGVCCDRACTGACETCGGGTCATVADGSDPKKACARDVGCGGACVGGACAWNAGASCDVCKACDGSGRCVALPADEDDDRCGVISCAALSSDCVIFADVTRRRCVALGVCASPNDPSVCTASSPSGACGADGGAPPAHSGGCSFATR